MPYPRPKSAFLITIAAVIVGGCGGGGEVTAEQRVERCLSKQPDATEADCKQWEKDGDLGDDGAHEGHENM